MYYETLDNVIEKLKHRFQQTRGIPVIATSERVLLNATNGTFDGLPDELKIYEKIYKWISC